MNLPKPLLIVSPTEAEAAPLLKRGKEISQDLYALEQDIHLFICGVGIYNAVFSLSQLLLERKYTFVLHMGVAGAFKATLALKQLVYVKQDCFADMGVLSQKGIKTLMDLGLESKENKLFDAHGFIKNRSSIPEGFQSLPQVNGATVNCLLLDPTAIALRQQQFDADVESMEGAAVAFVCSKLGLPYIQIRAISNKVGEQKKELWDLKGAIEALNTALLNLLGLVKTD